MSLKRCAVWEDSWQRCPAGSGCPRKCWHSAMLTWTPVWQRDPAVGFREEHGVKVFCEDATTVTNVSGGASSSLSAGQILTLAFSCHRRYLGVPDWDGSLHQGSELSYGRQPHLVISCRQLAGFVLNPVHFLPYCFYRKAGLKLPCPDVWKWSPDFQPKFIPSQMIFIALVPSLPASSFLSYIWVDITCFCLPICLPTGIICGKEVILTSVKELNNYSWSECDQVQGLLDNSTIYS